MIAQKKKKKKKKSNNNKTNKNQPTEQINNDASYHPVQPFKQKDQKKNQSDFVRHPHDNSQYNNNNNNSNNNNTSSRQTKRTFPLNP